MNALMTAVETVEVSNVVLNDSQKNGFNPNKVLASLEAERLNWEQGAYRTSNLELYGILSSCLGFCGILPFDQHKQRNEALEKFFKAHDYKYNEESPLPTRVVKAVFGNIDRRRVSTYSLVLRQAIKEKVSLLDLPTWIEERGGVQEIKLSNSDSYVSLKDKACIGKQCFVGKTSIGNAKSELLSHIADAEHMGKACVLLAEQMADGSFDIKAVVRSTGVINAAYVAVYSQQNKIIGAANKEIQSANDADGAVTKAA